MLAHLAQASRRPTRSWISALAPRRHYAAGPDSADPFKEGPSYALWLRTEGVKYKEPHRPNNWLGGEVVESVALVARCACVADGVTRLCAAVPPEPDFQAAYAHLGHRPGSDLE